jgi:aminoglycoside N3'-acetyltransferase
MNEPIELSQKDIEGGFVRLGLRKGMFVEVHSSLRSFGRVVGGAATVIDALKSIITSEGAIVMPSFPASKPLELTDADRSRGLVTKIKILDPDSDERTGMGIIADTFKKGADVVTGRGPHRVSAWGAEAELNAKGLGNLHRHDGYGLLIGVDIYRLTSMHYVEGGMPEEILRIFRPSKEVLAYYPENEWIIETGKPPVQPWYAIQAQAYEKGYITDGYIGKSKCMFFKVNDVINLYKHALETDPLGLFGIA